MNKYDSELISKIKAQRLQKMLANSDFTFRKLSTLASAIGETESATASILSGLGAKKAKTRRGSTVLYKAA